MVKMCEDRTMNDVFELLERLDEVQLGISAPLVKLTVC